MKFRTRLVLTLSALTTVVVGAAFGSSSWVVERSEERQLDEALRAEAHLEASDLAGDRGALRVNDRGGPAADDIGRLKKFAVIYGNDGSVIDITSTFASGAPQYRIVDHPASVAFDFWYGPEHLRGVFVAIPQHEHERLLLAAPRSDMEKDNDFLRQVMLIAALLSIGVTILVTWRVVRRLTRGHEEIAAAAHKVADGDLWRRASRSPPATTRSSSSRVTSTRWCDGSPSSWKASSASLRTRHTSCAHRSPRSTASCSWRCAARAAPRSTARRSRSRSTRRGGWKALAEDLLALARIGSEREAPHTPVALDEVAKERRLVGLARSGATARRARRRRRRLDGARSRDRSRALVPQPARQRGFAIAPMAVTCGSRRRAWATPYISRSPTTAPASPKKIAIACSRRSSAPPASGNATTARASDWRSFARIARVHGGDVLVEDRPGGPGARFLARLPAARI